MVVTACGPSVPPSGTELVLPPAIVQWSAPLEPTPVPAKQALGSRVDFVGWVDGFPTVGIRDPRAPGSWRIRNLGSSGWLTFGDLPDGGTPVTDGATIANIPDPEGDTDVAIAAPGADVKLIALPTDDWAESWRGLHGLVPLSGRTGYLLVGAAAIAVLDDEGALDVRPVPDGFVALAPTSDPQRFLLATVADAREPFALSEATAFAAHIWAAGSNEQPKLLKEDVVAVVPSIVGLSWLRTADGSWWSLTPDQAVRQVSEHTTERSMISPDGRRVLRSSDHTIGCAPDTADPCSVSLIDDSSSTRTFVGPSFGGSFSGSDVGMVLDIRPTMGLPWRLVYGPADAPKTIPID